MLLLMAEIRRSPVEVGSEYPIIFKVSAPSQVVQDFSHQMLSIMFLSPLRKNRIIKAICSVDNILHVSWYGQYYVL